MNAQTAVDAGTGEADEDAELGRRPLRVRGVAIAANIVIVGLLDCQELDRTYELAGEC